MTPQFSVFTPSHKPHLLPQAYESLKGQTCADWEWLILPNNGATIAGPMLEDKRVRVLPESNSNFVGALKRQTCEQARGDVLVELDHDDFLTTDTLSELRGAFEDEAIGFAYSNAVHCDMEFRQTETFSPVFGWEYTNVEFQGHRLLSPVSFEPTPEAVSRIWYAPNHVRAFRRRVYEAVGGYNPEMRVLDDQDLMARLYCATGFRHIDKPLYVYRIHGENEWLKHGQEIQSNVMRIYDSYIVAMALAHTKRKGLRAIDLGGRFASLPGFETVDLKDADIVANLNLPWPFADGSVGALRAFDVFEHLSDPLHTMREVYRVLAPGGMAFLQVPSTEGRGAFQDPTHRSYWNENSWLYYTHRNWARYIDTPVRFQAVRSYTTPKDRLEVCWTVAHLVSLKDGYRPPGLVNI